MVDHADVDHSGVTGFPALSGVSLTKSATQGTITTETAITFDGEDFDTNTYHDNSTNPARITVPTTGYYMIGGSVEVTNLDDNSYIIVRLRKNGSTVIQGRERDTGTGTNTTLGAHFSKLVSLTASDYVELTLESNDAGGVTARASADGTCFWAFRVA